MMHALRILLSTWDESTVVDAVELLVEHNVRRLRRSASRMLLYVVAAARGLRYRSEPSGSEDWLDIDGVIAAEGGDCEDLAAWRVAELRVYGAAALAPGDGGYGQTGPLTAAAFLRAWPGGTYHCLVEYHINGVRYEEDPSVRLGMYTPERKK
jgi:hypothetical protein